MPPEDPPHCSSCVTYDPTCMTCELRRAHAECLRRLGSPDGHARTEAGLEDRAERILRLRQWGMNGAIVHNEIQAVIAQVHARQLTEEELKEGPPEPDGPSLWTRLIVSDD